MRVVVEILTGRFFQVEVEEDATVEGLKKAIKAAGEEDKFEEQRLVLVLGNGRLLTDDHCALNEYGVLDGSIVYLFFSPVGDPDVNWLTFCEEFVTVFLGEGDPQG
ncbi:hypothetical protein Cni_G16389 [Canna indica]|uniref:Ubiquitin-like domain-containing protein n=1 Tax=Canna indica TaxID=4628 RepID=A0AAQ3KEZ1_9LILI|nr:hypothetical protein Cni_G16389 [Canna indica]